jgi:hypothetical protein
MRPPVLIATLLLAVSPVLGCAHDPSAASRQPTGAVGTSPLAPFDDVNVPRPTSREQLAAGLRKRGFLPPDAPEGTQLGWSIRQFQKSEGIPETGFPDDETLRRLGIDPATKDRTLDTAEVNQNDFSSAGVGR